MQIKHGFVAVSNRLQTLKDRIRAIRLQKKQLATLSGLDEDTVGRTLRGRTIPLSTTLDRIEQAVAAEEARIAAHLGKISGDAA